MKCGWAPSRQDGERRDWLRTTGTSYSYPVDRLRVIAGGPRRVTIDTPGDAIAVGHYAFTPAPLPDVLSPAQAAELLQVSEHEVVELAEAGTLPGRRIGAQWRFSRPALIAWLAGA